MERMFRKFFSVAALLSMLAINANETTPTLVLRSQGFHGDRQKWVGEVGHIHLYDMESWYGTLDIAVGYMRSFREDRLARCLFGTDVDCCDGCATIKVQGSEVTTRDPKAWLADYFYLNCNFDGSFRIRPRIQNVVVDLDFYLGLDEWANGLYFRIYGPINWTKWETGFCPSACDIAETVSCSAGYLTPSGNEVLLTSLECYFGGGTTGAPKSVDNITFQPLKFAKMPNCDQTETGFADLRFMLGWDFLSDEDYHLGVNIQAAAPTGNKRRADFVMDPVVGNGNHWELGAGLNGHYVFWRSEDEEKHFGFYFDLALTHMFDSEEQRTFDLKGKDNSRYMLAAKFKKGGITGGLVVDTANALAAANAAAAAPATAIAPSHQFNLEYAPVANLTSFDVDVSIGVQADLVAMFNFTSRGFAWDIGYDFWGRTCEDISCPSNCDPCNPQNLCNSNAKDNFWALKGDGRMFGYEINVGAADPVNEAVALSSTQSKADIHAGTNAALSAQNELNNFGVDAAGFAYGNFSGAGNATALGSVPSSQGGLIPLHHMKTSRTPVILQCVRDIERVETRGISHTVFTHISYTWDRDNWVPYLGIGGSAEFGKAKSCNDCDECPTTCTTECDNCVDCALSQWAVWVKGGLSFN